MARVQWPYAPITDRNSTWGFVQWTKLAQVKPIYGVELAVDTQHNYWTFLAIDDLTPLHSLIYEATRSNRKFPRVGIDAAMAAPLIKIGGSACQLDALAAGDKRNFYLALSPSTPKGLVKRALERGVPLLASGDNYFPAPEDKELYRLALGSRYASTQTYPQFILSDDEWQGSLPWCAELHAEAINNRNAVAAQCNAELRKASLLVPEKPTSLLAMCQAGAVTKGVDLSDPTYAARLEKELGLIAEKKFEDYFYILADIMQWARARMAVGPARGSSCGSLTCYLLDITTIDPIPHGLIFERFIDLNRADLPDIDADFSDKQRDKVFEYAEAKFGREHVARLGTVTKFKARSALKQIGKSLRIPEWRVAKVNDSIIERSSGDSRAMLSLLDTLNETEAGKALIAEHPNMALAARLEGHPSTSSQHAAGLLITEDPIINHVAMDARTRAAWCDKADSEALSLLKIDALGLTQLSIFERCFELAGIDSFRFLESVPLDDEKAFAVLNDGRISGIFQFAGMAMRGLTAKVKVERFSDIVAMTALARPGPMGSGGTNSWVARRNGTEPIATVHPMLTELTRGTYGVVIYQETVMRIVREIGRMSWKDTSAIRKAMSASLGDEFFEGYWQKFLAGASENGIDEMTARAIWAQINKMGEYSFNLSHAVAYGMVSYWCCWLKAHHPLEFAAASLDAESDAGKQIAMLRELADEGIGYTPVDADHSVDRWTINGNRLVGPLNMIKGIGPVTMARIMDSRRSGEPLSERIRKQLSRAKTEIDSLYPIRDRVAGLFPDLSEINITTQPTRVNEIKAGDNREVMIIARISKIDPRSENEANKVAKRNGRLLTGPVQSLNMFVADDTDEIFCKINRWRFEAIGRKVMNEAVASKSLYAIKGIVPNGTFRMIDVQRVRYLGEME